MKTSTCNHQAILLILLLAISSCYYPIFQDGPDDFAYHPPAPIEQDTTSTDTIPVDTCTELIEITDPPFVQSYIEITDDLFTPRTVIIGDHSAIIPEDDVQHMAAVIDSLWELYRPEYSYQTVVSTNDSRKLVTFIKGTNDRQQFYLHAQIRYNGYKQYMAFATQEIIFAAPMATVDEYIAFIDQYPSVARFGFYGTEWDSTDYNKAAFYVNGRCSIGRDLADLRHNPFEAPDTVVNALYGNDWDVVLHGPSSMCVIDLRDDPWVRSYISYDPGCQIIAPIHTEVLAKS